MLYSIFCELFEWVNDYLKGFTWKVNVETFLGLSEIESAKVFADPFR